MFELAAAARRRMLLRLRGSVAAATALLPVQGPVGPARSCRGLQYQPARLKRSVLAVEFLNAQIELFPIMPPGTSDQSYQRCLPARRPGPLADVSIVL